MKVKLLDINTNLNGRRLTAKCIEKICHSINSRIVFGEFNPDIRSSTINLSNVAIQIKNAEVNNNQLNVDITPISKIAKEIINSKQFDIKIRAIGTSIDNKIIDSDTLKVIAVDLVSKSEK